METSIVRQGEFWTRTLQGSAKLRGGDDVTGGVTIV